MSGQLKVGFLAFRNPYDKNSYSGVLYYMMKALEQHPGIDLRVLGSYPQSKSRLRRWLTRGRMDVYKYDGREFDDLDVILAPAASNLLAQFGETIPQPIILVTDATPSYLREFYPLEVVEKTDDVEIATFNVIDEVIYSSQFMADRAKEEFPQLGSIPVSVAPYGVNLDQFPKSTIDKPSFAPLKISFIGNNWDRKGGVIALATLNELLDRGVDAHLTIVGDGPAEKFTHPNVTQKGFIDKQRPEQAQEYVQILRDSHILISPTRADCTPMIIGEANAYSTPVVITNVGGVGSLIRDGVNGEMMKLEDGARDWADAIERMTINNTDYEDLCIASYQFAQLRLSWESWAQTMFEHASELVRK